MHLYVPGCVARQPAAADGIHRFDNLGSTYEYVKHLAHKFFFSWFFFFFFLSFGDG